MSKWDDTTTRAVALTRTSERRLRLQATIGAVVLAVLVIGGAFALTMSHDESRADELERAVRLGREVDELEHSAMSAWSAYWEGRSQSTYKEMREIANTQVFPPMDEALDILDGQDWSLSETEHMWEIARECVTRSRFTIERNVTQDESLTAEENSAEQKQAWSDRGSRCNDLTGVLADLDDELDLERGG